MMKIYDIIIDEMQLATNTSNCGDITIENWDRKSFRLEEYVRFRILLRKQSLENREDTFEDVTACYSIKVKVLNGAQIKDNSICFRNVQVMYSRLVKIEFKDEKALS